VRIALLAVPVVLACSLSAQPPSVRPAQNLHAAPILDFPAGGQTFTATSAPLDLLVATAYGITLPQLSASPALQPLLSNRYDIEAHAPHAASRGEMLEFLQQLLRERFKLVIELQTKGVDAYLLTVDKGGTNVRITHAPAANPEAPLNPTHARGTESAPGFFAFKGETMPEFAWRLSELPALNRVVLDRTGLSGSYDFELNLAAEPIFTAMPAQLGLKLLAQKVSAEILTVKSVQKPAAN